jgi:predicted amidohydrolase YtcJ
MSSRFLKFAIMKTKLLACIGNGIVLVLMGCSGPGPADLIIDHGKVVTVDPAFSIQEAVAVKDGKIIDVGSGKKMARYRGSSTRYIDAKGLLVLPGLVDAHAHLVSLGNQLVHLDINACKSFAEIVEKVAGQVKEKEPGEWIVGGRWDQTEWASSAFPEHDLLSRVSPENPVYLTRVDGNSAFVNRKALELAGIDASTPDPPGGKIIRKENGEPTGVLINQAMNLVKDLFRDDDESLLQSKLQKAVQSCLAVGLTGVHEAGVGPEEIAVFKKMVDEGLLGLRVNAMLGEQEKPTFQVDDLEAFFREHYLDSYGGDMLQVKTIKLYFDGALGSRGAAFFEPYEDDPDNIGLLRIPPEYITEVTTAALKAGMSVGTHCIGIRGNRLCLEAYERALQEVPTDDHRLRIEHAQVVRPEDIRKFAELQVIPAMQPIHCTSDKDMVPARIGMDRAAFAYAWKTFLEMGLTIPCGSDFPVESNDPLLGIYAAVSRKLPGEARGWHTEQRMTIEEAIKGYTMWAAHAAFMEDKTGTIEIGKYADFTILDRDILDIDPEEILDTKVMYTIVGGKIMHTAEKND